MLYEDTFGTKVSMHSCKKVLHYPFLYPVVAKGNARIRVQLSAGHSHKQVQKAIDAFIKVGKS